ncbi:MAG: FMN-binding protein, partial [Victivallales bacterium]|nr:FMN-binding protein [Victivallales bacterium]
FNSPVSLVTGILFVAGAGWIKNTALPTGRVYVLDALGSFAGALAVTLLLAAGVNEQAVFFVAAILLGAVPVWHNFGSRVSRPRKCAVVGSGVISLLFMIFLVLRFDAVWHDFLACKQWNRMLPGGEFRGSFSTPQARYYYGGYRGEFSIVRWNGICESLPNGEAAWAAAAENLAEKPDARKILIIGSGALPLCRSFCELPGTGKLVWLDTDPDYPSALLAIVPEIYRQGLTRLATPRQDIRDYVKNTRDKFDLIINLVPAPGALALNRYYSADFYCRLKGVLRADGVLSVGFPGGENFMGTELKMIGASLLKTLQGQFRHIVLKPGSASRFFASDADILSIEPEILEKRLAGIKTLSRNFPPQNIYTLFDPFRAGFQKKIYLETISDHKGQLLNSDDQPVTSRFAMLLALKKSGFGALLPETEITAAELFHRVVRGIIIFLAVRIVLGIIFPAAKTGTSRLGDYRVPDADVMFFVWITSVMGMGINILLLYVFQVVNGALFLYFGLISALFMLGLFAGGQSASIWFAKKRKYCFPLFSLLLLVLLGILRVSGLRFAGIFLLGLAFLAAGTVCGLWLPRAAAALQARGWCERNIAWQLWLFDSLGGAFGGLLSSVLLLPLFGALQTLDILLVAGGTLFILSLFLGCGFKSKCRNPAIPLIIVSLLACSLVADDVISTEAAALKPPKTVLIPQSASVNGKAFVYYKVQGQGKEYGYIFSSAGLVKGIKGYGGELELLLYINTEGELLNFRMLKHHETLQFFNKVKARKAELLKKNIFTSGTAFATDGVTGATYSSKALVATLNAAGKAFKTLLAGEKNVNETAGETVSPPPGEVRNINIEKYRRL